MQILNNIKMLLKKCHLQVTSSGKCELKWGESSARLSEGRTCTAPRTAEAGEAAEQQERARTAAGGMAQPLGKTAWQLLSELNHSYLAYEPAITLSSMYSNERKACIYICIYTNTGARMFKADVFTSVKTWKPPRRPPVGEWTNCGTSRQRSIIQH